MKKDQGNHSVTEVPSEARPTPLSLSDRVRSLRLAEQPASAPRRRSWLPWILCLALAGTTTYFGVTASTRPDSRASSKDLEKTTNATIAAPAAQVGEVVLESKGYIIPAHQIKVSPKVSGMVVELKFQEGDRVREGAEIARLETTDYKADYDRASSTADAAWQRFLELYTGSRKEEIQQAKAELDESEAQRKQLYLEFKRSDRLKGGPVTAREYEQAESAYKAMDRRVERLRHAYKLMLEGPRQERIQAAWSEVQQAEADLAKAGWRLDNCTIRAPVTGTILVKKAEKGDIVNPVAFNISASICEMADLADLEVELTIQERDIARVFKDQKCRIRLDAFPDLVYEGHVSRLMPIADRAKGAVPVRVRIHVPKDEEGHLKPEMGAVVSFLK